MKTTIFLSCIAILTLVHVSTLSQQSINDECITLRFNNDIPSSPSINDKIVDLPLPFAKNVQATKKRKKKKAEKEKIIKIRDILSKVGESTKILRQLKKDERKAFLVYMDYERTPEAKFVTPDAKEIEKLLVSNGLALTTFAIRPITRKEAKKLARYR